MYRVQCTRTAAAVAVQKLQYIYMYDVSTNILYACVNNIEDNNRDVLIHNAFRVIYRKRILSWKLKSSFQRLIKYINII